MPGMSWYEKPDSHGAEPSAFIGHRRVGNKVECHGPTHFGRKLANVGKDAGIAAQWLDEAKAAVIIPLDKTTPLQHLPSRLAMLPA